MQATPTRISRPRIATAEPHADPLDAVSRTPPGAEVTMPGSGPVEGPSELARTRITRRPGRPERKVDMARERAIHEELMKGKEWEGWRFIRFVVLGAVAAAFAFKPVLDLSLVEMAQAFVVMLPVVAIGGVFLGMAGRGTSEVLPAFREGMAGLVIVAVVVGAGAFHLFYTTGRLDRPPTTVVSRR